MGGSESGDQPPDVQVSNDTENDSRSGVRVAYSPSSGTATQRAVPSRSTAGASASVSISMPRTAGPKSSGGGAPNGHSGSPGVKGAKGHYGSSSSSSIPLTRRHLLCFTVLLLLPLGFFVKVHLVGSNTSSSSSSSSISLGSRSSSGISSSGHYWSHVHGHMTPVVDLKTFDLSRFTPIPMDYGKAKAYIMAAAQQALGDQQQPSSSGSSSSSSSQQYCIPPERAMTWDQIDSEIKQETGAAAAGEAQQQQQQQADVNAAAVNGRRRVMLEQAAAAAQQTTAPVPATATATPNNPTKGSTDVLDEYYDSEAAAADSPQPPAAAAAVPTLAAAATNGLDEYYDLEAATEGTSSSSSSSSTDVDPAASTAAAAAAAAAAQAAVATTAPVVVAETAPRPTHQGLQVPAAVTAISRPVEAVSQQPVAVTAAAAAGPVTVAASLQEQQQQMTPQADDSQQPATSAATPASAASADQAASAAAAEGGSAQIAEPVYKPAEPEKQHLDRDTITSSSSSADVSQPSAAVDSSSAASSSSSATGSETSDPETNANPADTHEYEGTYDAPAPAAAATAVADPNSVDQLQIALVNDVEFHHEVTLGLMSALQKHRDRLTVYLHDSMFKAQDGGSYDFVSYVEQVMPGTAMRDAYYKEGIKKTDVAIFVSPEFSIDYYREFIRRATPRLLIVFIHEPNMELRRLQYIINMHPLVGVAALSPHVAETVKTRMRMNHVHWMMPVMPVQCDNPCWEGFAVQGKFEGTRRTYSSLWEQMQQHLQQQQQPVAAATPTRRLRSLQTPLPRQQQPVAAAAAAGVSARPLRSLPQLQQQATVAKSTQQLQTLPHLQQRQSGSNSLTFAPRSVRKLSSSRALRDNAAGVTLPRINVLGSGRLSQLGVPQELRPQVHVYKNLGYTDYYDTLCRSLALLPLFNSSSGYLSDKISSTVLASVATAVPMMVPTKFLEVYTIFKAEHVLVLDAGSEMAQLVTFSQPAAAPTLAAKRRALEQLRHVLNYQATAKLEGLMRAAIGRPHATTKQD